MIAGLRNIQGKCLAMLSGGGDSVALLNLTVAALGPDRVEALHVNYGLRADADLDEIHCRRLCDALGVRLHVHTAHLPATGNLQANARDERYRVAFQLATARGLDHVLAGHTADDHAETVLYRLVTSPGRRALRGMAERDGRLLRPLLGVRRAELRSYLADAGLEWREDESNADPRFARSRVRQALGQLAGVHPTAVANINDSATKLRLEDEAMRELVTEKIRALSDAKGEVAVAELTVLHPAVVALIVRELAERAGGRSLPVGQARVADLIALSARGGTRRLDLGAGVTAQISYGRLRVVGPAEARRRQSVKPTNDRLPLDLPGEQEFHGWRIRAEAAGRTSAPAPIPTVSYCVDLDLGPRSAGGLGVRGRRRGDRLRPRGLGGSKSLQDVFVDRKVPRDERDRYPVVCFGDEIVWVPGVVVAESAGDGAGPAARLVAIPPPPPH